LQTRPGLKALLFSLLIGILGPVLAYFGIYVMLVPALLAFVFFAWGEVCFLVSLGVLSGGFLLLFGLNWVFWAYLLCVLLGTALLILGLKRKMPYRHMVIALSFLFVFFQYSCLCLPSILAGEDTFAQMRAVMDSMILLIEEAYMQMGMAAPDFSLVYAMLPDLTVLCILGPAMGFGFLDVLVAYGLCKKWTKQSLRPMAKLPYWQLPRSFLTGAMILSLGGIAINALDLKDAGAMCMAIECILILPFALGGFAFREFNGTVVRKYSRNRRIFGYVLYAFCMPYTLFFLALTGAADLGFRLRERYTSDPRE